MGMGKFLAGQLSPAEMLPNDRITLLGACRVVLRKQDQETIMRFIRSCGIRPVAALALCTVWLGTQALRAQETKEKVTVDDVDRTFMVRLPKGYDPQRKYPVVILLHGLNQDADDMERLTGFDQLADKDGVIAVYPAALHGRWNVGVRPTVRQTSPMGPGRRRGYGGGGYPGGGYPGGGYPGGGGGGYPNGGGQQQPRQQNPDDDDHSSRSSETDDIGFFSQMLDQLTSKFAADPARIYTAGLSEGGFMSMRLGCSLGDRIAGVAAIGAAMPKTMTCLPPRPVPVVMIDGTSDPIVPYGGGTEHNLNLATLSVEDSAKAWARIDHCGDKPAHAKLPEAKKGAMETKTDTYDGCGQGAEVLLYSVKGAGNTWPGGEQYEAENAIGKTSEDLNANEVLWSFLVTRKIGDAEKSQAGSGGSEQK
jgi:poly(3-hydroxybutyrate) depolymerase